MSTHRPSSRRTEDRSPRYCELDSWAIGDVIEALYEGHLAAAAAVHAMLPAIAAAADHATSALSRGGRLVYAGAGTSGRIGVQDGAELTPTFGWPSERVAFLMAGGFDALLRSVEGGEDSAQDAARAVRDAGITESDVVVGIAASGSTPYTVEVLRLARAAGAVTIALANNADTPLLEAAQHAIVIETGAEAVAGSTRLKGGTAQKIVLNVFSTAVMIKLGHTYRGFMVDVQAHNTKLLHRATSMVAEVVPCSENDAAHYLKTAQGNVKIAVLIGMGLSCDDADVVLARHAGNLRASIDEIRLDTRS